jgi:LacI family transcriptional regulator
MGKKFKNKDLAARLGVSGTLVSLVLNNKADEQGISKETQETVLALARKMGYFKSLPDNNENPSVEERPGVVGMIVPSLNDPFVNQITPYLQKAFADIGVGFSILTRDPDDQRYDRMVAAFKKFFSGLILLGEAADENTIRALRSTDYPMVVLEKPIKTLKLNSINTDSVIGAQLIVDHVVKLGYRKIVIIADQKMIRTDSSNIQDIINLIGLRPELNKPIVVDILNNLPDSELDFNQFEKFLRPPYSSDVMIIMKANLVYPVMAMLRRMKLRIPQDIAVVSMEEGIGLGLMFSPVTCLKRPLSVISSKVANIIWSEVKNSGKGKFKRQLKISPELVIRNSCGTI